MSTKLVLILISLRTPKKILLERGFETTFVKKQNQSSDKRLNTFCHIISVSPTLH
jgi:hypothetical protein